MSKTPSRRQTPQPFFGLPAAKSPNGAHIAVFGAPHGTPYPSIDNRVYQTAPAAFRRALEWGNQWNTHWDWDFGGPILPSADVKAVDLGDLATKPTDAAGNRAKIESTTRAVLAAGAVPIMFGGDDSVPIPFLAAFEDAGPVTIVQIDAHIDWRHEREGVTLGFSSPMRRASEMRHVKHIVQAGARGIGSARAQEVDDARTWGVRFITARHVHHHGIATVLDHIEPGANCVICLDLDALDVSEMPAVAAPSPGGLSYVQVTDLITSIAAKARIAGFCMVEFVPERDLSGNAAFTAAKIATHVLGHVARQTARKRQKRGA